MKKVNNIIQVVKKSYELYSNTFHEYFKQEFDRSLVVACLGGEPNILSYDYEQFNKFVDHCVFYRLGISDVKPKLKDIVYDLSATISPTEYEKSVEEIFREIVYCAFPAKLTSKLQRQLEAHKIESKIIDFIIGKLEVNIE